MGPNSSPVTGIILFYRSVKSIVSRILNSYQLLKPHMSLAHRTRQSDIKKKGKLKFSDPDYSSGLAKLCLIAPQTGRHLTRITFCSVCSLYYPFPINVKITVKYIFTKQVDPVVILQSSVRLVAGSILGRVFLTEVLLYTGDRLDSAFK